ncbi:hypothetical protein MSG28_004277, partial [Choristoneura fumiferana]
EALGGKALPCIVDVRDEKQIQKAIDEAIKKFNGIDILVNNASAISLTGTAETDMKRYDLMHSINTRGNIDNLLPDFFLDVPGSPSSQAAKKIPTLFAAIGKSLSPELVQKTQAVYQFNVSGKEEGVWHIDLKNGDGSCGQGEPKNPPDATLTMDGKNFADMFAGKLKPATAFMMGKLKIKGDLQKAMKLEKMMKSLQKKN